MFKKIRNQLLVLPLSMIFGCKAHLFVHEKVPTLATAILSCEEVDFNFDNSVIIAADSQLHNLFGSGLVTNSRLSQTATRVAQRPAAMNLWGDTVLHSFIGELKNSVSPAVVSNNEPLLFFLGDAANVACTDEYRRFASVLESFSNLDTNGHMHKNELSWLMVHGNHDSYMMGNFNSYGRHKDSPPIDPSLIAESEWLSVEGRDFGFHSSHKCSEPVLANRSWDGACAHPTRDSVPMYKGVWLRHYLMSLQDRVQYFIHRGPSSPSVNMLEYDSAPTEGFLAANGLTSVEPGLDGPLSSAANESPRYVLGFARDGTAFAKRNLFISGKIYSRAQLPGELARNADRRPIARAAVYGTFIVQSLDISKHVRAILIDSSNIDEYLSSGWFANGAGTRAKITDEQLQEISYHAKKAHLKKQQIVFFAHNPLYDLPPTQRETLLQYHPVAYVSGHTHLESSVVRHKIGAGNLIELNVASTTDWPMEAMLLSIDPQKLNWRVYGTRSPEEVKKDTSQTACSYRKLAAIPDEKICSEFHRDKSDYLGYLKGSKLSLTHGLCKMQTELRNITEKWPIPVDAFTQNALSSNVEKTGTWQESAELLSELVDEWQIRAREPGLLRNLALCQAKEASWVAWHDYRGCTDPLPERSEYSMPASAFSAAVIKK